MVNLTRKHKSLAQNFLMMPFVAASIIFVMIAGLAIGFNYQGDIKVALGQDGGELEVKSCQQ